MFKYHSSRKERTLLRRAVNDNPATTFFVIIGLLFVTVWLALAWIIPDAKAQTTLEEQGYTNIQIADKDIFAIQWRSCNKTDLARFTATAETPDGISTQLHVCVGPFSADVVRSN